MTNESEWIDFNRLKFVSPYLCLAVVVAFLISSSNVVYLIGIPAWALGFICSTPNFNLADGFLAQLALIVSLGLFLIFGPIALHIGLICWLTWLISSTEMAIVIGLRLSDGDSDSD